MRWAIHRRKRDKEMPTDLYQCLCQHHRLNSELCLSLRSKHHLSWDLTGVLPRPFYFLLESHLFHRSMYALHAQNKIDFPLLSLIVFDCCICFLNICFLFSYHSKFLILFYYLPFFYYWIIIELSQISVDIIVLMSSRIRISIHNLWLIIKFYWLEFRIIFSFFIFRKMV